MAGAAVLRLFRTVEWSVFPSDGSFFVPRAPVGPS